MEPGDEAANWIAATSRPQLIAAGQECSSPRVARCDLPASPVTVTSTALVVLPHAGQHAPAAARGQPGPFTATQEVVIAGSDSVLARALPDMGPVVSLAERRGSES